MQIIFHHECKRINKGKHFIALISSQTFRIYDLSGLYINHTVRHHKGWLKLKNTPEHHAGYSRPACYLRCYGSGYRFRFTLLHIFLDIVQSLAANNLKILYIEQRGDQKIRQHFTHVDCIPRVGDVLKGDDSK